MPHAVWAWLHRRFPGVFGDSVHDIINDGERYCPRRSFGEAGDETIEELEDALVSFNSWITPNVDLLKGEGGETLWEVVVGQRIVLWC